MTYKPVTLAAGGLCKVRQLGLFELDNVGREILGIYRYSLLLATGQIVEDEYDLRALDYTPTPPDVPASDIKQGTDEWYQLEEYQTYLAALAHEKLRVESYEGYVNDITAYILGNCLQAEDRNRLTEPGDWDLVYSAALVPQLTLEGVAACLRDTFYGFIQGYAHPGRDVSLSGWQGQDRGLEAVGS